MRVRTLVVAIVLALAARTASAQSVDGPLLYGAPKDAPSGPLLGAGLTIGSPAGSYVRVRENQIHGNQLDFGGDLGIDVGAELAFRGGWRFGEDDALALRLSHIFVWGGTTLAHDVNYNGSVLEGGKSISTTGSTTWWVIELSYQHALFRFGEDARAYLAFDAGIRFDYLNFSFNATLAPTSLGHETAEHFYSQATPIPFLGLTLRYPVGATTDFYAYANGFYWNHISSGRSEGGIIYYTQYLVQAGFGLAFQVIERGQLAVAYRFLYNQINEHSNEDDNKVVLILNGVSVGFTYTF
jgi:hypothetical protein